MFVFVILDNELTDDEAAAFFESIEEHPIIKLNLSYNRFSDASAQLVGRWIGDNNSLLDLNLSWNHFRKKAGIAIANGISVIIIILIKYKAILFLVG